MSQIDMTQLLNRLRATTAMAEGRAVETTSAEQRVDFAALMKQTLDAVNDTQQTAGSLSSGFETGDPQISLEDVMIARQKANISFQAVMQVRNKLVNAYQEIMSMQI